MMTMPTANLRLITKSRNPTQGLRNTFTLVLFAIPIGLASGLLDAGFGEVLIAISAVRAHFPFLLIPLLPFAGLLIVYLYQRLGKNSQKGMGLIFASGHGDDISIPKRLIPLVIFATWLTHLFGGSAGREGVAVQIGGTIGYHLGKYHKSPRFRKNLLMTGMAAGFAGLFQTPIAATFFALEIFAPGKFEYAALLPALAAAFIASTTSHLLGLEKFTYLIQDNLNLDAANIVRLLILALCFGFVGRAFAALLEHAKPLFAALITNPYQRIALVGSILALTILALHQGRYAGLGTDLISASFQNGGIQSYDWLFKLLFTVVTLAAGFQGGEVTPLFAIGATLGSVLAAALGVPVAIGAALGFVSVFAAGTNSLLCPIFIAAEVFGYQTLPIFVPFIAVAYAFTNGRSIYPQKLIAD